MIQPFCEPRPPSFANDSGIGGWLLLFAFCYVSSFLCPLKRSMCQDVYTTCRFWRYPDRLFCNIVHMLGCRWLEMFGHLCQWNTTLLCLLGFHRRVHGMQWIGKTVPTCPTIACNHIEWKEVFSFFWYEREFCS